jgi:Tol biopolymer transport system component
LAWFGRRRSRRPGLTASLLLTLALAATVLPASPATAVPADFLTRQGTELLLDGSPFRFTGLNIFNANSDGLCGAAMDGGTALDDALTAMGAGAGVFRSWFFQPLAIDEGTDLRDWSAFDHTLDVAAAHGKKVIATLTDQWGECGTDTPGNGYKEADWYVTGYQQVQPGMLVSYRDWVAEVVDRYKDDPRIAFWQLINEAEVTPCPPGDLQPHQTLVDWATDISGLVKSIDANHLVSLGTIGSGQCGADGPRYQAVHAIPTIDLCEYHDYGAPGVGMPGDEFNGLQLRIDQCNALNKPLFVGEAGIIPNDVGGTFQARADAFQEKLDAQFSSGVRGFLAWAWSPQNAPVSTLDNYDIGPGDPALGVLAAGPDDDFAASRTFLDPEAEEHDRLGYSVDYHGADIVVGAPFEDTGATDAGSAFVFRPDTTVRLALRNPDPSDGDSFGFAVASVGPFIAVGAVLDDSGGSNAGAVYVFDGSDGSLEQTILDPDPADGDQFGHTLAAAGGRLVVGAPYDDLPDVPDGGKVFVFDPDTGDLIHETPNPFPTMIGTDPETGDPVTVPRPDRFGLALAASGSGELLVGAPQENLSAPLGVGRVYRFDVSSGDLTQTYEKPREDGHVQGFGWSVAQIGSNLVVGAPFASDFSGSAFLIDGDTGAELRIWVDPTFAHSNEKFGWTVTAVDGRVVVGAPEDDTGNPGNRGGLYVFEPGSGAFLQEITSPTPTHDGQLGFSLASRGTTILAGAPGEDVAGESAGAAYLFDWAEMATVPSAPLDPAASAGDGSAEVSWSPPASNGGSSIVKYTVTTTPAHVAPVDVTAPDTSVVITGLTNGTSYTFTITATNGVGTGPPSEPTNAVTPNAPPDDAAGLGQFEANGSTPIPSGATTDGTTVVLKGTVSDPDGGQVRLQVEVEPIGTAFDGNGLVTGAPVPSGSVGSVSVGGLVRARGYHWRARTIDGSDATSANWVSFGGNLETAADFLVEAPIVFSSTRHGSNNANQQEIYSMAPDGTGAVRLTTNITVDTDPSLSPDGTKIAFESNRDGDYEIFVMDVDGTDLVKLTTNTAVDQAAVWSPDGTKIAFVSNRASNNYDVWTMNADGTNHVRLTTVVSPDGSPTWSPDGTRIAFTSSRDKDEEIFVMNANGSAQVQLTVNNRRDISPAWSPNGMRIAFSSNRDATNNLEIYAMNVDGSSVVKLTTKTKDDLRPAWSRSGMRIAFEGIDTDSDWEIYRVAASGGSLTKLTNNGRTDVAPGW